MSWVEIETDIRYLQEDDPYPEQGSPYAFDGWPEVSNIFERKLAANIRNRKTLSLDLPSFVRVAGLASQLRDCVITFDVEVRSGWIEAQVAEMRRNRTVMPPITSDSSGSLEFALRWFAVRALPCRLSVSPDSLFWIPLP